MKKMLMGLALTITLTASVSAWAQSCDVPVCDIPASLAQLEKQNQSDKSQMLKNLRTQYRAETSEKILLNLKDFAKQSKSLFESAKEEDWVIREAQYLINQASVGLVKYSAPDRKTMIAHFSDISDEGSAYDALNYWAMNVDKLESYQEVLEVVAFAEFAKLWSVDTKQEAYVEREADKIIQSGGVHLSRLNPIHEGSYEISSTTCKPKASECGSMPEYINHLTIMETLGARGLMVSFFDRENILSIYSYTTAVLTKGGTHIHGEATEAMPWNRVSEVDLDVDPVTGNVKGTLKDVAYKGTLHFTAKPVRRISKYYTDQAPARVLSLNEVLGRYVGVFGTSSSNAEIVISQYQNKDIVGTLDFKDGGQVLPFKAGSWNSKHGVLTLASAGSSGMGDRKMVLALRKDKQGKEVMVGFMFNTTNSKLPAITIYKK